VPATGEVAAPPRVRLNPKASPRFPKLSPTEEPRVPARGPPWRAVVPVDVAGRLRGIEVPIEGVAVRGALPPPRVTVEGPPRTVLPRGTTVPIDPSPREGEVYVRGAPREIPPEEVDGEPRENPREAPPE
jgi:hypothetical protein